MDEVVELHGVVEYVQYPKMYVMPVEFTVFKFRADSPVKKIFTVTGEAPNLYKGDVLNIRGRITVHERYGEQITIETVERDTKTEAGLEHIFQLLFGPKTTEYIEAYFQTLKKAYEVLNEHPEEFLQVKNIGEAKLQKALTKKESLIGIDEILIKYKDVLTVSDAMRIHKKYQSQSLEILAKNPYDLIYNVDRIGFQKVDTIARKSNIPLNDVRRIESGIFYIIHMLSNYGDIYFNKFELVDNAVKLLKIKRHFVINQINQMLERKTLKEEFNHITLGSLYEKEQFVIDFITNRIDKTIDVNEKEVHEKIDAFEKRKKMQLSPQQRQSIVDAMKCSFYIISGGPGTGKTTTLNCLLECLDDESGLASPTGKAAKRMMETTGKPASTIHVMLGVDPQDAEMQSFEHNEENPLEFDTIVIDESSMLDLNLTYHLFKAIPDECRVILVGDVDQLPPVGSGQILKDAMVIPNKIKYDQIFRQKKDSNILKLATEINERGIIDFSQYRTCPDIEIIHSTNIEDFIDVYRDAALTNGKVTDKILNSSFLIAQRRGDLGTREFNRRFQELINPPSERKKEIKHGGWIFREGDVVIQTRNNYQKKIMNGFIGIVHDCGVNVEGLKYMIVEFEGETVEYTSLDLDDLELGYSITVHKSQGSEYENVFLVLTKQHRMMYSRALIYTAVTRAKKKLYIITDYSDEDILYLKDNFDRKTLLAHYLRFREKREDNESTQQ